MVRAVRSRLRKLLAIARNLITRDTSHHFFCGPNMGFAAHLEGPLLQIL